ncbi:hypothetical protein PAAG_07545 [Paracoccidioides lutzii Pb01]|uniref:Uncharacterized protein n=1 Tax=Paracoccidioides lutzii (strain ATCC MYA-826 / Pb01) TaxID=502779 RepID=C1H9V4_PARBA|nr:hypothetical protein PAAG_07545 [Paracoccidioides lutzii Pb01]EEH37127.1 hypothetical protein PAAG_07545 [Paracoccidioides lutzii Pb01]
MASNPFETHLEDPAPSYEESLSSTVCSKDSSKFVPSSSPSLLLPTQLADTRTYRINDILTRYVDPLLFSQGTAGLYRTTFVLIPSSVSSLQDAPSNAYTTPEEPQVVGFPSTEVVKLIRLRGEENAMEFWRQPAVVAELDSGFKARLVGSGHRLHQPSVSDYGGPRGADAAPTPPTVTPATTKRSFWGWKKDEPKDVVIVDRKLGWRSPGEQAESGSEKIPPGLVNVSIVWKDVCLRIANEMGLYESKKGPALCITVEVGS